MKNVVESGHKFKDENGTIVVKDGIKAGKYSGENILSKPSWLKIKVPVGSFKYDKVSSLLNNQGLNTVCKEAKCPNLSECWSAGTATIMLMGSVCTRACSFCSVNTGNPKATLDSLEPLKAAKTVKEMGLKYVVLTSVDRDDLTDGGSKHYAETVRQIKLMNNNIKVETLTPDFNGIKDQIKEVIDSGVDVFAHNIETVKRLSNKVRDPRANYAQSLNVLKLAKEIKPNLITKSSVMLGMGEKKEEVLELMDDLLKVKCDIFTLGQYLQPTKNHYRVHRYITPKEFSDYRKIGKDKGFMEVVSGVLVRSSYKAEKVFEN